MTDRDTFIQQIITEVTAKGGTAEQGTDLARLVLRNAATIQRLAVEDCNRGCTSAQVKQDAACQRRITAACHPWGITPTYNGDPRGAVVKLLLPSGTWNSFGGREDGFCVPT